MNRLASTLVFGLLATGMAFVTVGCRSGSDHSGKDSAMKVQVQPSAHKALVGETITFLSRPENTLNHDAKMEWKTTGGTIKTEQDGRIARVTFTEQGTFTVSGILMADGKEVDRSDNTIQVTPVP